MPGPVLHLGATVLCSHGGQATPAAPFPRVTGVGPAGGDARQPLCDRRLPVRAARRQRPLRHGPVRHLGDAGARRRRAGAAAGQRGRLRADRHAHAAPSSSSRAWSGADACSSTIPYHFDGRERTAETGIDDARPRPDRAAPVHPARRAGEPPRLRLGRDAAGLRGRIARGRRDRRVPDPRRAAAMARRPARRLPT